MWLIPLEEEEEEEEQVNGELAKKEREYYCKVQRGEFPDTLWGFFLASKRGGGWLSLLFLVLASCSDKSSEEKEKEKPV